MFQVRGAGSVAGVGNGNPSDHDPDQAHQRHAFNGLGMVVVRAGEKAGVIQLTATAPGLRPASLNLQATHSTGF
jgi:beta-galactosidase